MTLQEVAAHFPGGRWHNGSYTVRCPCHNDTQPSLAFAEGRNGGIVACCGGGCETAAVMASQGLSLADLAPPSPNGTGPGTNGRLPAAEQVYRYDDERGEPLYEIHRTADKKFFARLPGATTGGIGETRRVLYGLPELLRTQPGEVVGIVEGEKDVGTLRRHGLAATTNPGGASLPNQKTKWRADYTAWLAQHLPGRRFAVFADNDPAGEAHAASVYTALVAAGLDAFRVELPDLPPKGDVTDWLQTHPTAELLATLAPPAARRRPWASAPDLMARRLAPLRWIIPGLLPEGLCIWGGRPKQGKSWGLLGVALAAAAGGRVFGKIAVEAGDVLLLALEDGERRLQDRMRALLHGEPVPDSFDWATTWPSLAVPGQVATRDNPDFFSDLNWWLDEHPAARLVIVDTFQRIKSAPRNGHGTGNAYEMDMAAMAPFHRLATDRRISLVLVTHTRKPAAGSSRDHDFLDEIQGSTGVTGSADTIIGLRKSREDHRLTLSVRGREVDEAEYLVEWCPDTCAWSLLGEAAQVRASTLRKAILACLAASDRALHYREVATRIGRDDPAGVNTVKMTLWRMSGEQQTVLTGDGRYRLPED